VGGKQFTARLTVSEGKVIIGGETPSVGRNSLYRGTVSLSLWELAVKWMLLSVGRNSLYRGTVSLSLWELAVKWVLLSVGRNSLYRGTVSLCGNSV